MLTGPARHPSRFPPLSAAQDVSGGLDFGSPNTDERMNAFRDRRLLRLEELAKACEEDTARWYSSTPPFIDPATGCFRAALCAQLANFLDINATEWLMQFAVGSPLTGILSQQYILFRWIRPMRAHRSARSRSPPLRRPVLWRARGGPRPNMRLPSGAMQCRKFRRDG